MNKHVIVAGGGIVGCMTAMELAGRGCRVTIVERGQIASQTSGESSWAGAGILFPLLPWFYAAAVDGLALQGAALYHSLSERLLRETGIDIELRQSGMLLLPALDEARALDWCRQHRITVQAVMAADFGVQSPGGTQGLWLPEVAQVRPPRLMQALRQWLVQNGVTLLEHTELKPLADSGTLQAWETLDGRTLEADAFVVTSGAWSFDLLKATTRKLDIKPMRGQILLYRPTVALKQMVYREGFYLVPRQDGYLLAGSTLEDVGFDQSTTATVRAELSAKAEAILPRLKGQEIIRHWSGLRPGTPENLPIISAHPHIERLYLNTGHFRYGLTMAPASAKIAAALVLGERSFIDPAPFACPR